MHGHLIPIVCSNHGGLKVSNDEVDGRMHLKEPGHKVGDHIVTTNGLSRNRYFVQLIHGEKKGATAFAITASLADIKARCRLYESGHRELPGESLLQFIWRNKQGIPFLQDYQHEQNLMRLDRSRFDRR